MGIRVRTLSGAKGAPGAPGATGPAGPTGPTGAAGADAFLQSAGVKLTSGNLTTASTTFVDLTGVTVTLTTGAHRCLVFFNLNAFIATAQNVIFDIAIDGTLQGGTLGLQAWAGVSGFNNANFVAAMTYLTAVLSAAAHTIKIQWRVTGGTGNVFASASAPALLTVLETNLTV